MWILIILSNFIAFLIGIRTEQEESKQIWEENQQLREENEELRGKYENKKNQAAV